MKAKLIIGDLDISGAIAEGGLVQGEVERRARSIEALDGALYKASIVKRTLTVTLVTIRDDSWTKILKALKDRPVSISYVDDEKGDRTALFWVSNPSAAAKKVYGGHTWVTGATFSLEEK